MKNKFFTDELVRLASIEPASQTSRVERKGKANLLHIEECLKCGILHEENERKFRKGL